MNQMTKGKFLLAVVLAAFVLLVCGVLLHFVAGCTGLSDFSCWGKDFSKKAPPAAISCNQNGPGVLGTWVQKIEVEDHRTGGTKICVTSISGAESILYAEELIAGRVQKSQTLWNANPSRIEGVPKVDVGPDGSIYLYIPLQVTYAGGTFTMTQGLELSAELPTLADLKCQKDGMFWDELAHSCRPAPKKK